MDKRYDEFAVNCSGCGWLKPGTYLDGTPYLVCKWHGTIMTSQSDVECRERKTEEQVRKYLDDMEKNRNKNTRKR